MEPQTRIPEQQPEQQCQRDFLRVFFALLSIPSGPGDSAEATTVARNISATSGGRTIQNTQATIFRPGIFFSGTEVSLETAQVSGNDLVAAARRDPI